MAARYDNGPTNNLAVANPTAPACPLAKLNRSRSDSYIPYSTSTQPGSWATDRAARDHAILAATLDPIVTIDARGIIQSASDSVERVLGWKPAELSGQSVNVLMPEPHRSAHDGYLARYQATGITNILNRPRRFEAVRKDKVVIPIELCVSRADIKGGGPPLFVGLLRDMTTYVKVERSHDEERVRFQQQLAQQTSALAQATLRLRMTDRMASIGTLAAGLGHDMNNVLLPVRARLDALNASVQSGAIPASERKHVDAIRKCLAYLQQLADGLHFLALDPDAVETSHGDIAATDLRTWWSQSGALLSKAVPKHVRVIASFPSELPPAAIAAHGLTQALLNLIVNAGEAIPSAGPRRLGYVRVKAESVKDTQGSWIRLKVSDNGSGMSPEVQRRAFEMFFTTKPRGLGTGLGLPLVRKVAEKAGGRIEIKSEPGKGTTVIMMIPAFVDTLANATRHRAALSLSDGRAAALVSHVLQASGTTVDPNQDPARANIWIIDSSTSLQNAKAWRTRHPKGQLVFMGTPSQRIASWNALRAEIIRNPRNFEAIRTAIGRVIAAE